MALEELYKEVILDHYKNPRNKRELPGAELSCSKNNPLCGDEITVNAHVEDGRIAEVDVRGVGVLDQPGERLDDDRVRHGELGRGRATRSRPGSAACWAARSSRPRTSSATWSR